MTKMNEQLEPQQVQQLPPPRSHIIYYNEMFDCDPDPQSADDFFPSDPY